MMPNDNDRLPAMGEEIRENTGREKHSMTKKNLVSLVLASALLLTLAACGEKAPSGSGSGSGAESTSVSGSQAEQPKVAEVTGGSERESAEEVSLDTKLKSKTVREENQWFSFTTDETENATYRLTTVNMTRGTGALNLKVLNQYGEQMHQYTLNAEQSGKASTLDMELPPDTTYYIYLAAEKGDTIQYSLTVHAPEDGAVQR